MRYIFYLVLWLLVGTVFSCYDALCQPIRKAPNYSIGADVVNVHVLKVEERKVYIGFDIQSENYKEYYYVTVHHQDYFDFEVTEPSDYAISGDGIKLPIYSGRRNQIIWDFNKESLEKQSLRQGEFVIELVAINKNSNKQTYRYAKIMDKLKSEYEEAELSGKYNKMRRIKKRMARRERKWKRKNR